jgi:hypothetical protein
VQVRVMIERAKGTEDKRERGVSGNGKREGVKIHPFGLELPIASGKGRVRGVN